jgi:putative salt-induced outer membrane protein YdiY
VPNTAKSLSVFRYWIAAWIALTALLIPAVAADGPDTIYFVNGDRLIGTIKQMNHGQMTFDGSPSIDGDLTIDWKRIARIDSARTFQFTTREGERFLGRMAKAAKPGSEPDEVRVITPGGDRLLHQNDIVMATQTLKERGGLLEASVSLGLTLSRGNNQKQFNADTDLTYTTPRYKTFLSGSSLFTSQENAPNSSRHELQGIFSWNLSKNWAVGGLADYLKSQEQDLNSRIVLGGGPIRTFINTNTIQLRGIFGADWASEHYSAQSSNRRSPNQYEGLVGAQFELFKFRQWQLTSNLYVFPSITTGGRVRTSWNTSFRYRLIKGKPLWWSFNQAISLDNKPPVHARGNDFVTTTSLTWTFP